MYWVSGYHHFRPVGMNLWLTQLSPSRWVQIHMRDAWMPTQGFEIWKILMEWGTRPVLIRGNRVVSANGSIHSVGYCVKYGFNWCNYCCQSSVYNVQQNCKFDWLVSHGDPGCGLLVHLWGCYFCSSSVHYYAADCTTGAVSLMKYTLGVEYSFEREEAKYYIGGMLVYRRDIPVISG